MKLWLNSMIVLEPPMGRSSPFCRGSDSQFSGSQVAHDHKATYTCNQNLCNVFQGQYGKRPSSNCIVTKIWRSCTYIYLRFIIRLYLSKGYHHYYRGCIKITWAQIPVEQHVLKHSGIDWQLSLFWLSRSMCMHSLSFNTCRTHLSIPLPFPKRTHRSIFRVSSCGLS